MSWPNRQLKPSDLEIGAINSSNNETMFAE